MHCPLCRNGDANRTHVAREMMFGSRDTFTYVECGACGCLSIAEIPHDLGRFYGDRYYSMRQERSRSRPVRDLVKRAVSACLYDDRTAIGSIGSRLLRRPERWTWLSHAGATFDSRILDVGCGSGGLLRKLKRDGFRDLTGIDPFVPGPLEEPGLRILKGQITDTNETFDVVMLHHSLEHMPDQEEAMRGMRRVVRPGGTVLVRIPIVAWAWRTYGVDWVQLDAPRHLLLHTERSIRALAERTGFEVATVAYDSSDFQLWGSEQYRRDVPLHDRRSCAENDRHPLFTSGQMRAFRAKARELNASGDGDQACFYLRPSGAMS